MKRGSPRVRSSRLGRVHSQVNSGSSRTPSRVCSLQSLQRHQPWSKWSQAFISHQRPNIPFSGSLVSTKLQWTSRCTNSRTPFNRGPPHWINRSSLNLRRPLSAFWVQLSRKPRQRWLPSKSKWHLWISLLKAWWSRRGNLLTDQLLGRARLRASLDRLPPEIDSSPYSY